MSFCFADSSSAANYVRTWILTFIIFATFCVRAIIIYLAFIYKWQIVESFELILGTRINLKIFLSHENQISYIDSILHVDFQPNLEDSDTQVDEMLFHIERSFHKAQSIRMDQDIDSQYMLCYLDNRYHVDIPPFVLQIILKVSSIFNKFQ